MIFVDTGAFVGRYLRDDQHHEAARAGWRHVAADRLAYATTDLVLNETITLLARFGGAAFAAETGRMLCGRSAVTLLRPDEADELAALDVLEKYAEHGFSFCDAVSMVVMRRQRLRRVFGFDHHFTIAGFELWPPAT